MASQRQRLFGPTEVLTTGLTYTAPARTWVTLANVSFTNITASAVRLDISITPSGGSSAVVTYNETVPASPANPGGTVTPQCLVGQTLNPGDALTMTAGTAAALNVTGSGVVQQ